MQTVYIDIYFLLNFSINLTILGITRKIAGRRTGFIRIIITAVFGSIYSFCVFFPAVACLTSLPFKLLFTIFSTVFAFGYDNIRVFLKNLCIFYGMNFILSGCTYAILNHTALYNGPKGALIIIVSAVISYIVLSVITYFGTRTSKIKNNATEVEIVTLEGSVTLRGFFDSGNHLIEPYTKKPVIIAEEKTVEKIIKNVNFTLVPYSTIGCKNAFIKCFYPLAVRIDKKEVICAVGLCEHSLTCDNSYNVILNEACINNKTEVLK